MQMRTFPEQVNFCARATKSLNICSASALKGTRKKLLLCSRCLEALRAASSPIKVLPVLVGASTNRLFPSNNPASTALSWVSVKLSNPKSINLSIILSLTPNLPNSSISTLVNPRILKIYLLYTDSISQKVKSFRMLSRASVLDNVKF